MYDSIFYYELNFICETQKEGGKPFMTEISQDTVRAKLIQKMIEVESDFNPKTVSHAGAMGLMQLMPANVKEMGVKNPFSPAESIEGGVKELSGYLKKNNGDLVLALASYNAGPGNVRKYGGVPPFKETQGYIKKILNIDVSK